MNLVALYVIYAEPNPANAVFWLKAFGAQAISFPSPSKFDGVLPVLSQVDATTIFAVPQRSKSLAHVIPSAAVVNRKPIHGLDLDPARAYVAALDDPAFPLAEMAWRGNSAFHIRAPLQPGQVVSVQVTWMPGWQAFTNSHPAKIHSDQLGLMILEPDCQGDCEIDVYYGVTPEAWFCRTLSALATLALAAYSIRYFRSNS